MHRGVAEWETIRPIDASKVRGALAYQKQVRHNVSRTGTGQVDNSSNQLSEHTSLNRRRHCDEKL